MKVFDITVIATSASSYVRDAAAAVNEEISAAGYATALNQREIESYVRFAEERISECDADFQNEMKIEVNEVEYEDE